MTTVVQGRWGFHPCTHAVYLKLKRLNYLAYRAKQQLATHSRWSRKLPKNRVVREWLRNAEGQKIGSRVVGPMPEPLCPPPNNLSREDAVLQNYRKARYPKATPAEVKPLTLSEAVIDDLLLELEEWFEKRCGEKVLSL